MNLIDLIIIVVLLIAAIDGIKKGFLKSCFAFLSSIVGLFAAIKYNAVLSQWVETKFSVLEQFESFFSNDFVMPAAISQLNVGTLSLPDIGTYMDKMAFSADMKMELLKYILKLSDRFALTATTTLGEVLNLFLSEMAFKAIIFIAIWFVASKVAFLLSHILLNAIQGTMSDSLDKVGGVVLGLGQMVFVMTVIFGMLYPLSELAQFTEPSFFVAVAKTIGEAGLIRLFHWLFGLMMGNLIVPWL